MRTDSLPAPAGAGTRGPHGAPDVVCLGETMVMLTPEPGHAFPDLTTLQLSPGGAESNVALGLAAAGYAAAWISRLGDDEFGDVVLRTLTAGGVEVGAVERDATRPTGLYLKVRDQEPGRPSVRYYRSTSAAAAMGPELLARPAVARRLDAARLIHLSGITPALSPSCEALVLALTARERTGLISFDVNHRLALWDEDPAVLLRIAARCDIVFVGADEARAAFGLDGVEAILAALPDVPDLIIKDDSRAAHHRHRGTLTTVPSLSVEVLDAVGAGDAFAAGFLAGLLAAESPQACLRRGHAYAAAALVSSRDRATPPTGETLERLLDASPDAWEQTRVDHRGFHLPASPNAPVTPGVSPSAETSHP